MSRYRAAAIVRGVASLVVLAVVIAGVPAVLIAVSGFPVPHQVPSAHEILAVLGRRDDGTLLVAAVRLGTWLAWAAFTSSATLEAACAARGTTAPRLAAAGGLQHVTRGLVAAVVVAFSSSGMAMAAAAPAVPAVPAPPAAAAVLDAATSPAAASPAGAEVTVQPGQCLWSIAQQHLGSGELYREIARLNYGRDMGGGQRFTSPELIRPGWVLLMPSGQPAAGRAAPRPAAGWHQGHPGASGQFSGPHAAAAPSSEPAAMPAGQPPAPAAAGSTAPAAAPATAPAAESTAFAQPATAGSGHAATQFGMFAAGMLSGGILMSLGRLRHRQRQARPSGRRIALPATEEARRAEGNLRAAAAGPGTGPEGLRAALAVLAAALRGTAQDLPAIAGVHLAGDDVEILLAEPRPHAPAPFTVTEGTCDMCWRACAADLAGGPAAPGGGAGDLLPGLVTAGRTPGGGTLLIDLEAAGVTLAGGDPRAADRFLVTAALELATNPWAGSFDLLIAGFSELSALSARAQGCASIGEAIACLEARARRGGPGAAAAGAARQNRLADPASPDWDLTLLIARDAPSAEDLQRIASAAAAGTGIAALLAAAPAGDAPPGAAVIDLRPGDGGAVTAVLQPMSLTIRAQLLDELSYAAIAEILAATQRPDTAPDDPPYGPGGTGGHDPGGWPALPAPHWPEDGVRIQVLRPFAITGTAQELQPKHAELVLALALAGPAGLTNSALCTMLGPNEDAPKPPDSLRQIITRARRRLGTTPAGGEYIVHAGNARYVLDPAARLDWSVFRDLAAAGRDQLDRGLLREAVGMLGGQPLDGVYHWWVDAALIETIRATVTDTAELLSELELQAGDPAAAGRAARAGLDADRSAERLWRAVMRAADASGSTAGVHEAWQACLHAIADIAPDGEPHPDTSELYARLTRHRMAPAGSSP